MSLEPEDSPLRRTVADLERTTYRHGVRLDALEATAKELGNRMHELGETWEKQQIHLPAWSLWVVGALVGAAYAVFSLISAGRLP